MTDLDVDALKAIEAVNLRDVIPSADLGPKPELAWLPKDWLYVDPSYQRSASTEASASLLRRILQGFTWQRFQPITVTARDDGRYAVVDGQHRAIAALMHPLVEEVPAWVIDAATVQDQAKAFVGINRDRVAMKAIALYRAQLAASEPDALQIAAVCKAAGVTVVTGTSATGSRTTVAVSSIRQVIKSYGEKTALATLLVLADASGINGEQIRSEVIKATAAVISRYRDRLDETRLVKALSEIKFDQLVDAARQGRALVAGSMTDAMSMAIVRRYDHGLANAKRLSPTDSKAGVVLENDTPPPARSMPSAALGASRPKPLSSLSASDFAEVGETLPKPLQRRCACNRIFTAEMTSQTQCPKCVAAAVREAAPAHRSGIGSTLVTQ